MPSDARSHRLRKGRISEPNRVYLITITCWQRQTVFLDWRQGRCAVNALMTMENWVETLCFVVMPDHIHWLMKLNTEATLSEVVQKFKSLTTKHLRGRHFHGQVWQPGFHDRALRAKEDVLNVARYIVANPLRAGLVCSVRDYPLWDAVWL